MPDTSELIEFRRAFVWLLCGMLLPSVALVAFGVVAVANERAAVERRLAEDYTARLEILERDLLARLDKAADSAGKDRLVQLVTDHPPAELGDALRRLQALPEGAHLLAGTDAQGEHRVYALWREGLRTVAAQLDLARIAAEVPALAAARFPRERAGFRLLPPVAGLSALRRIVAEVAPAGVTATIIGRLPIGPPLDGYTLTAELPGDDPAAAVAFRNRTLYIGLLVLLYIGIGLGFGLTIREMRPPTASRA